MAERVQVFPEPPLEFRYRQPLADPHDGLAMFGPYDADLPSHPKNISYALIGTAHGIEAAVAWARAIQGPIYPDPDLDQRLWPAFPGFEAAFACSWSPDPARVVQLDDVELVANSRNMDPNFILNDPPPRAYFEMSSRPTRHWRGSRSERFSSTVARV